MWPTLSENIHFTNLSDWLEVMWYDIWLAGGRVIWYLIGWRSCDMISDWLEVMWYVIGWRSCDIWLAGGHVIWYLIGWRSCDMISDWLEVMWYVIGWRSCDMSYTAGHGRDSDLELLVLYNHWIDTLDRSLVRKNVLLPVLWPHSQANA